MGKINKGEIRNTSMSHRGIHGELYHNGEWKKFTIGSRECIDHNNNIPDDYKNELFERINKLFV